MLFRSVGSMGNTAENKDKPTVKHLNQKRKVRFPLDRVSECSLKVLYKGYDEKRDRFVTVLPKWGMKKALLLYPKASVSQDFDFETKMSFPIYGFWSLDDMTQYHYFWSEKEGKTRLLGIMEERKETFLNAWRNSA